MGHKFNINDTVRERPDEAGESRFTGKIVGFSEVYGQKLAIVQLDSGFYSNHTDRTPLYTSLLVVHPSNLIRL